MAILIKKDVLHLKVFIYASKCPKNSNSFQYTRRGARRGCLIIGCIFRLLVGGPCGGAGRGGLTSRGLRSIGLVQNYRNSLISLSIVLRLSSYEALS